jgi:hypothetical protein
MKLELGMGNQEWELRQNKSLVPAGETQENGVSYLIDTLFSLPNIIPPRGLRININNPLHGIIQLPKPEYLPDTQPLLRLLRTCRDIFLIAFLFR